MKQINKISQVFALLIITVFTACDKDSTLSIGAFEYAPSQSYDTTTPLGKKLQQIKDKYRTQIIYNWDSYMIGYDARAVPPEYEKVYDFVLFMEEVWFKPYYSDEFLKNNLPHEIVLVGGNLNYGESGSSGSFSAAGQAESQYRIVVGLVNDFRTDFTENQYKSYRYQMEKILHHEFAHILNKRYPLPDEYVNISKGLYMPGTYSFLGAEEAMERGFIRSYGASSEMEDFATMVEEIATRSENTFLNRFLIDLSTGQEHGIDYYPKLYTKYKLVLDYYKRLGVDLQRIGDESEDYRITE